MAIATNCKRLKVLHCDYTGDGKALTDAVLTALASNCGTTFEKLYCSDQKQVTTEALVQFNKQVPRVRFLCCSATAKC